MKVEIFVEGGGNSRELKKTCRLRFGDFFRKAGFDGCMPRINACGSRQLAYQLYCNALEDADQSDFIVLLVDSEGPVAKQHNPWQHLRNQDGWEQPDGATDDSAHLMVQVMESWFLADKEALAEYFGQGFNRNALPSNPNIEDISKADVLSGLEAATRQSRPKGKYGKDSFNILAKIDPSKVIAASQHAQKLIDTLKQKTAA